MPHLAWMIPAILAGGGAIAQNQANHSAQQQNQQQQQQNQANTKEAYQTAKTDLAPWLAPGASPFAGQVIGRPGMMNAQAFQPQNVNAGSLLSGMSGAAGGAPSTGMPFSPQAASQPGGQSPIWQMIQQIMQSLHPPAPASAPTPQLRQQPLVSDNGDWGGGRFHGGMRQRMEY